MQSGNTGTATPSLTPDAARDCKKSLFADKIGCEDCLVYQRGRPQVMQLTRRLLLAAAVAALVVLALPVSGAAQLQPEKCPPDNANCARPSPSVQCYLAGDGVREVNVGSQFGYTDADIRAALELAKRDSCRVWFRSGTYVYSSTLPIEGLTVVGDGDSSVLSATTKSSMAVVLSGVGPQLRGVKITCPSCELPSGPPTVFRLTTPISAGVLVRPGTSEFVVENVTVERAGSAGMFVQGGHDGRLTRNRVRDTLADAYHVTRGAYNIDVGFNHAENSAATTSTPSSATDGMKARRTT